jgi:hypothetical protein
MERGEEEVTSLSAGPGKLKGGEHVTWHQSSLLTGMDGDGASGMPRPREQKGPEQG